MVVGERFRSEPVAKTDCLAWVTIGLLGQLSKTIPTVKIVIQKCNNKNLRYDKTSRRNSGYGKNSK